MPIFTLSQQWRRLPLAVRVGAVVYLVTRLIHSLIAILALKLYPLALTVPQAEVHNWFEQWLLAPWYRWDAEWYMAIAAQGYAAYGRSAYYPLYPLLVRGMAALLADNYLLAGLVVSNVALLAALIVLFKLVQIQYGEKIALISLIMLVLYPAYFFNLGYYAESSLLFFSIATFYALERQRWLWVTVCAGLAVLAKLTGVILLLPILWEFWRQRRRLLSVDVLALLIIPATMVGWVIVRPLLGGEVTALDVSSPLSILSSILPSSHYSNWGTQLVWPWQGIWLGVMAVPTLWSKMMGPKVTFDLMMLLFFTVLLPFVFRLQRASYVIYVIGSYIMNLILVVEGNPLANFPRRMVMAFPVFIVLAMVQSKWLRLFLVLLGGLLSLLLSGVFVLGGWVG